MKAGVLIAGSLAWDTSELRSRWRDERLDMDHAVRVSAPLRYGRLSHNRENTYTMVYSVTAIEEVRSTGVGLAVPFSKVFDEPKKLLEEAVRLWHVESRGQSSGGTVSASWGCVALLVNPGSEIESEYLSAWTNLVSYSPEYGDFLSATGEQSLVDAETGLAVFPWPEASENDSVCSLDFLLLTATKPRVVDGCYPNVSTIAKAWNDKPHRLEYFTETRRLGIRTAEDEAISALLISMCE